MAGQASLIQPPPKGHANGAGAVRRLCGHLQAWQAAKGVAPPSVGMRKLRIGLDVKLKQGDETERVPI